MTTRRRPATDTSPSEVSARNAFCTVSSLAPTRPPKLGLSQGDAQVHSRVAGTPVPAGEGEQNPSQALPGRVTGEIKASLVGPAEPLDRHLVQDERRGRVPLEEADERLTSDLAHNRPAACDDGRGPHRLAEDRHFSDHVAAHPERQQRLCAVLHPSTHLDQRVDQ